MSSIAQFIVADDDRSVRTSERGNILITDVGFPDGDVLDVLPRIKEKRPDLQIIVMSARTNLLTAIKTQKYEVVEYFPKPFELGKLIEVCNITEHY